MNRYMLMVFDVISQAWDSSFYQYNDNNDIEKTIHNKCDKSILYTNFSTKVLNQIENE